MGMNAEDDGAVSLDRVRTRKFFERLAEDSFIALVVTDDGEVTVFSKDIDPDHLTRIRTFLIELREGEASGEEE